MGDGRWEMEKEMLQINMLDSLVFFPRSKINVYPVC